MAQHGLDRSIVASQQSPTHSDPFVGAQNTGAPGTKRSGHCRSVPVQRGIKYFPERAASAPPGISPDPLKKATWRRTNAAFVSFYMSGMRFYVGLSLFSPLDSNEGRAMHGSIMMWRLGGDAIWVLLRVDACLFSALMSPGGFLFLCFFLFFWIFHIFFLSPSQHPARWGLHYESSCTPPHTHACRWEVSIPTWVLLSFKPRLRKNWVTSLKCNNLKSFTRMWDEQILDGWCWVPDWPLSFWMYLSVSGCCCPPPRLSRTASILHRLEIDQDVTSVVDLTPDPAPSLFDLHPDPCVVV